MNIKGTPIVTEMKVIPVAGYDSMLLTFKGAHAPFFTRNIVIIEDSSGNIGLGEVHGGEYIRKTLEDYRPFVEGRPIGDYKKIVKTLRNWQFNTNKNYSEDSQEIKLNDLGFGVHVEVAVECALLDLLGQYINLPVASLLGDGKERDEVLMQGHLFYVADKNKIDLPYVDEGNSKNNWFKIRRNTTLDISGILEQAHAIKEYYGLKDFKLEGGVFKGEQEIETIIALKKEFPDANINIAPNGAWNLSEAIRLCTGLKEILTYVEDPCGSEKGFSGREITSEFKKSTGLNVATNMIAADWRQFYHSIVQNSVDIPLTDPHFWMMNGSVRVSQVCNDWGMAWGSHSNNHFDISLAIFTQTAAAAPGNIIAMDTHWIWQDGQSLTKNPYSIVDGKIQLPKMPGLGLEIDMDKVIKANELYNKLDKNIVRLQSLQL